MKFLKLIIVLCVGLMTTQGCDIVNPAETIPTYIHIDSFTFQQTPNTGTASNKITAVKVFFESRTIGTFDLPATVPIITDKPGLVTVIPCITFNGLQDIQIAYPFYRSDTLTIQPDAGNTIQFAPATRYISDTVLNILNLDFETGNPFAKIDGDTALETTNDPQYVFEDDYAGLIKFDADTQEYSVNLMQTSFTAGETPFLELNYKNSLPFQVGLQTTNNSGQTVVQYIVGFNPRDAWNKVYIGLQDVMNLYPNKSYRVVIAVLTDGPQNGFVALDNLKVLSVK